MMQRLVDSALGVAKESIKTFSQESFNNAVKLINGFAAIVLAVLPGKANALEGVTGWELHPTFRAPGIPKWMEERVSSFNQFIHDFEFNSDSDDELEYVTDVDEDDDSSIPSSPSSQTSRLSRGSSGSFSRYPGHERRNSSFLRRLFRKSTWPIRWLVGSSGLRRQSSSGHLASRGSFSRLNSSASLKIMYSLASKHFSGVKDFVSHHGTESRRRGIIEDLQLGVELFIERVFDIVRKWIHGLLSPFETLKSILRNIFLNDPRKDDDTVEVNKAILGDSDPCMKREQRRYQQTLNTDARTCGDFITDLGYPYESLKVTTGDGYILSMERIPRPDSKKVLYLQHGILDSSLGWVFNGVVGSQAFAAYDQGYDVFLGNFRGLVSREHVNKGISSQRYWKYSVNEHGTQDIPAMLEKVHDIKMTELKQLNLLSEEEVGSTSETCAREPLPYSLCGVSHSLGGAAMLMYLVTRRLEGKPHYMKRAILLSPAGFHEQSPPSCFFLQYLVPLIAPILRPIVPGLYIPTKFFRMLFNKLSRDFQNYPALGGLVQTLMSYAVGGDSSNWIGAFAMTHYNMDDMPGIAYGVALHLAQMKRNKRFEMFDFGSRAANIQAYGTAKPLDIAANYGVIDIPVDVVAGIKDKLIPKSMVHTHYRYLKEGDCKASYSEFEYAHLDFTFSHRPEVLEYVMARMMLVQPLSSRRPRRSVDVRRSKSVKDPKKADWSPKSQYGDLKEYHVGTKSMNYRRRDFESIAVPRDEHLEGIISSPAAKDLHHTSSATSLPSTSAEGPHAIASDALKRKKFD